MGPASARNVIAAAGILGIITVLAACAQPASRASASAAPPACRPTMGQHGSSSPGAGPITDGRVVLGPGMSLTPSAELVAKAAGEPLEITGVVVDSRCRPLPGARIEAWQANAEGEYGPPQGTGSGAVRCCYLQGAVRTDAAGRYLVETIKPGNGGPAPGEAGHIHFWVAHSGARSLSTELNFAGSPDARSTDGPVATLQDEGGRLHATFDIVLD
jgi:protocatechuate 3,4-dioxygenase beta subunit